MAHYAKKTEHAGPKKGRGAYAGRKSYAKSESNKARRSAGVKDIVSGIGEAQSEQAVANRLSHIDEKAI
ncbi:MAG: hypothetical protein RLW61_05990 [Gammaproteobacteria bacterium]